MEAKTGQCYGCVYWRGISNTYPGKDRCCHHLLDTGKRRERNGDRCLSKKWATIKRFDK